MSTWRALSTLLVLLFARLALATPAEVAARPVDKRPTVAVLYFDFDGEDAELGQLRKGFAQMLISDLTEIDTLRIIERARLQDVLNELELARSAKLEPTATTRVGKLLGARYLVLGHFFNVMGRLRFDARVVETETGRVVTSVGVHGKPEDVMELEQRLAMQLGEGLQEVARELAAAPMEQRAASAGDGAERRRGAARREKPSPPPTWTTATRSKVSSKAVAAYGRALDAVDRKDTAAARTELQAAIATSPGFRLAALDLSRLAL